MHWSTSRQLTFALLAFACVMMTHAALHSSAHANIAVIQPNDEAPTRDARVIRLRRSVIDTRARRDLDTAAQDQANTDSDYRIASRTATSELRLIQMAGPIKREW